MNERDKQIAKLRELADVLINILGHLTPEEEVRRGLADLAQHHKNSFAGKFAAKALRVDMSKPANRKGELPQALGLVSRKNEDSQILHQLIVDLMNHARHNMGKKRRGTVYCAGLVAQALDSLGKTISFDNVEQIYKRSLKTARASK